jgi:hypothetical protein
MYLRESTALQICVRNKLDKLKLKDYTETSEFFSNFEKLIIELRNAGAKVPEKEKLNYLLRTLPSSLSHIGDLIDVLKEEDQTVDFVKNKIKMFEEKEKEENVNNMSRNDSANVFKTERKTDKTCYNCNQPGHLQYECTGPQPSRNSWRGGRGRGQPQARGGARNQSFGQQRRFNSNSGGRGRGWNQRGRGGWQQ